MFDAGTPFGNTLTIIPPNVLLSVCGGHSCSRVITQTIGPGSQPARLLFSCPHDSPESYKTFGVFARDGVRHHFATAVSAFGRVVASSVVMVTPFCTAWSGQYLCAVVQALDVEGLRTHSSKINPASLSSQLHGQSPRRQFHELQQCHQRRRAWDADVVCRDRVKCESLRRTIIVPISSMSSPILEGSPDDLDSSAGSVLLLLQCRPHLTQRTNRLFYCQCGIAVLVSGCATLPGARTRERRTVSPSRTISEKGPHTPNGWHLACQARCPRTCPKELADLGLE